MDMNFILQKSSQCTEVPSLRLSGFLILNMLGFSPYATYCGWLSGGNWMGRTGSHRNEFDETEAPREIQKLGIPQ
jgi:hypothetical protein